MNFNIRVFGVLEIGGAEFWITETMVVTWIIMLALIAFAVVVRIKLRTFSDIPKGFQNVVELMIDIVDGFVKDSAGEKLHALGNWFFMVLIFMMSSILSGMIGLRPPLADWSMAFAFALMTLLLIQVMGIKYRKGKYIKGFFEPFPLFLPLNLLGELARPISLSFRLFGNIFAGMIIMTLAYTLTPIWARFGLPAALHVYFDIATGVIQTYIFCALSLAFIANAASTQED